MATKNGKATALTVLSPIKNGALGEVSYADITRERCLRLPIHEKSPFTKVPNTYLARLFILDDVFYESLPANDAVFNFSDITAFFSDAARKNALPRKDHLKSKYLVFSSNFYGNLDDYLTGMWEHWSFTNHEGTQCNVRHIWEHCVAFDRVENSNDFITYIKKCQLDASLFFNGSTDDSLQEQLKSLYLKQEFTKFAIAHQGKEAAEIQQAFKGFIERVQPDNLNAPSWPPGKSTP